MTDTKRKDLMLKYPDILGNRGGYPSVGDGWLPIIDKLCEKLMQTENPPVAMQIKEKFGGLRFYLGPSTEEHDKLVREAEHQASHTCEVCGAPGEARHDRMWIKTLCDEHNV